MATQLSWKTIGRRILIGFVVVVVVSIFWASLSKFNENHMADLKEHRTTVNKERGITQSFSDSEEKYSPSGLRYVIECIEGREFIISNPYWKSAVAAGPINDKEC